MMLKWFHNKPGTKLSAIVFLFLLIGSIAFRIVDFTSIKDTQSKLAAIETKLAQLIHSTLEEHQLILKTAGKADSSTVFNQLSALNSTHPYFVLRNKRLIYWSDHQFVPNILSLRGVQGLRYLEKNESSYLAISGENKDADLKVVSLVPLKYVPEINNKYLSVTYNQSLFESAELSLLPPEMDAENPIYFQTEKIFNIEFSGDYQTDNRSKALIVFFFDLLLFIISIVLLYQLIFSNTLSLSFRLIFFILGLVIIRFLYFKLSLPYGFENFGLFDPKHYASSVLHPSLGDLFINILLLLLIVVLIFRSVIKHQFDFPKWVNFLLIIGSYFLFYLNNWLIDSIYLHSQWGLDITDDFDLQVYKLISLLLIVCISAIYFFFCHLLFVHTQNQSLKTRLLIPIVILVIFVFYGVLTSTPFFWWILLNSLYLIVCQIFSLHTSINELNFRFFLYLFTLICVFSSAGSFNIRSMENKELIMEQELFANQILLDSDPLAEYLLSEVMEKVTNDPFIINRISNPFVSKEIIKEKIKRHYLGEYFNKYQIEVELYNSRGEGFSKESISLDRFIEMRGENEAIDERGRLYLLNDEGTGFGRKYVGMVTLKRLGTITGYIIIRLNMKMMVTENVYPELLIDQRFAGGYISKTFDYAVYRDNQLIHSSGNFNYLKYNPLERDSHKVGDRLNVEYVHRKFTGEDGRIVIVSAEGRTLFSLFSNFSFLFVIHFLLLLIGIITYALVAIYRRRQLAMALKIQLYFNIAFFIPLLTIAISTITFMNSSFREQALRAFLKKGESVGQNMQRYVELYQQDKMMMEDFERAVVEMAAFTDTDINVYDLSGQLMASSQPQIFNRGLLSGYLSSKAYQALFEDNEKNVLLEEQLGSLNYHSAYISIFSQETGELIAVLSSPYFQSVKEQNKTLFGVFTIIMNIFTVIFLLFLIMVYYASRNLSMPLRLISTRLSGVSLAKLNEPIQWDANDEIGLLVKEYNQMLHKLEKNKEALARTEKESAWRQMARQVAHEIKNPLTPMKLSLQHLSRTLPSETDEKLKKTIKSLLQQIDTLDDIASSFSEFAKMPIPKREKVELCELLKEAVELHIHTEHVHFEIDIPDTTVYVWADSKLMGRIFSNIIINAIQSANEDDKAKIVIRLIEDKSEVHISVADNGMGIPEEIKDKVFIPNFSTKYTGSGLGLAIAKRGVEHAGGQISFTDNEPKGTVFHISLPLA